MPDVETTDRNQDAVYWAKSSDDLYSTPKVSAGIAVRVRWEEKRAEMLDAQGETVAVDAQVVVDREIVVGSIFWLGKLSALSGTPPTPTSNIFQVVTYDRVPDIDDIYVRRTVGLKRYTDVMPALA